MDEKTDDEVMGVAAHAGDYEGRSRPLAGAVIASAIAWALRGPGDGDLAAQRLLGQKAAARLRSHVGR